MRTAVNFLFGIKIRRETFTLPLCAFVPFGENLPTSATATEIDTAIVVPPVSHHGLSVKGGWECFEPWWRHGGWSSP